VVASALTLIGVSTGTPINVARGLLSIDAFATFFKGIFLLSAALTILLSMRYLDTEGARHGEYVFLVLCATLGMMFMASGTDLITIFIGLETMAIAFYILTGLLKPSRQSNEAAVKYFLLGTFSLGLLLYGLSLLYGMSGTTNLRTLAIAVADHGRDPWLILALILVVAGIGFKIAAVPFHMWAPDVYEGAPTPITAFLSVGSKAASFAMLLRIFLEGLPSLSGDWTILFYVLSVLTMTVGNIAALTQSNLKRMLAYSSIAHAGYLLIGVIAGTTRGVAAMLIYLLIYAFMQMGAFAVVILMRRADAIGDELKDLSGLYARQPLAAVAMLVFMLSLGGIPPTAGFMGKFWLFGAAIDANYVWLAVLGVVNSAISLYYYLRVVVFMFMKNEATGSQPVLTPALSFAIVFALCATLALGVYPRPLFELAEVSARALGVVGIAATPF
jgi:NADH-quinone oxidoreductase subunit N